MIAVSLFSTSLSFLFVSILPLPFFIAALTHHGAYIYSATRTSRVVMIHPYQSNFVNKLLVQSQVEPPPGIKLFLYALKLD